MVKVKLKHDILNIYKELIGSKGETFYLNVTDGFGNRVLINCKDETNSIVVFEDDYKIL